LEKTDSELVNNRCPIHLDQPIEIHDEENYFFRFSKYQQPLLDLYQKNPHFVIPQFRQEEITAFVKNGLKDFSISRLKAKMPWGVPVPDDPQQVMYVWFDALINYISTLGWPDDRQTFTRFWPGEQIAGKDNLRQQAAMWQAMLLSAGLPPSRQIYVEGFITSNRQKMSKSFGNVIDPFVLVQRYGVDSVRYYLLREIPAYDDGDFSDRRFRELYTADLANGLGNLISRVAKLCERIDKPIARQKYTFSNEIKKLLDEFRFDRALELVWSNITIGNQILNEKQPWKLVGKEFVKSIEFFISLIDVIAADLQPFLPDTAEKITQQFVGPKIKSAPPLFPRLN
jgi:methionyl-tRNA synthetase